MAKETIKYPNRLKAVLFVHPISKSWNYILQEIRGVLRIFGDHEKEKEEAKEAVRTNTEGVDPGG